MFVVCTLECPSRSRVVVYSVQDDYFNPVEPSDTQVCASYALRDFEVQKSLDNGATWTTVASVSGNSLCKRTLTFAPVRTDGIRILIAAAGDGTSRAAEVEAFPRPSGQ